MSRPPHRPSNLKTDVANQKKDGEEPPPKSSPMTLEGVDLGSFAGDVSTNITSLPPLPSSPPHSPPRHTRESSRKLLVNLKSRTGSEPQSRERSQMRQGAKDDEEYRPTSSSMSKIYHLRKNPGSTPELSLVGSAENIRPQSDEDRPPLPHRPQLSPHHSEDSVSTRSKQKGFRTPFGRTKSIRRDSNTKSSRPSGRSIWDQPTSTAPNAEYQKQRTAEMKLKSKSEARDKSNERTASENGYNASQEKLPKAKDQNKFVTGGMTVMSTAKKGGNALFNRLGKIGRSSSSHERESAPVPDSEYVMKVINRPLVDQARITRISKNLGQCKDKTEFWMPSLPWRCIDYLNLNCESEGLYRVPGSGPQVKHWRRRFDEELDVDLLDEKELYDPNNIGSLLKLWLRELPDEIFPAEKQKELGQMLHDRDPDFSKPGKAVPSELKDTLSALSPYNYYLLFAVTCHLSLLLSHHETNRMDLHNLNICIGPCLRMERWLFNWLVGDWRHCWQGCYTEKQYLQAEQNNTDVDSAIDTHSTISANGDRGEDRPPASSGSQASRSGSHYSDARSNFQREMSPSREHPTQPEAYKPTGSPPIGSLNGNGASNAKVSAQKSGPVDRPKTSDGKKRFGENAVAATDDEKTPMNGVFAHSRSYSDLPLTPTKGSGEGFKIQERK